MSDWLGILRQLQFQDKSRSVNDREGLRVAFVWRGQETALALHLRSWLTKRDWLLSPSFSLPWLHLTLTPTWTDCPPFFSSSQFLFQLLLSSLCLSLTHPLLPCKAQQCKSSCFSLWKEWEYTFVTMKTSVILLASLETPVNTVIDMIYTTVCSKQSVSSVLKQEWGHSQTHHSTGKKKSADITIKHKIVLKWDFAILWLYVLVIFQQLRFFTLHILNRQYIM